MCDAQCISFEAGETHLAQVAEAASYFVAQGRLRLSTHMPTQNMHDDSEFTADQWFEIEQFDEVEMHFLERSTLLKLTFDPINHPSKRFS